MIIDCKCCDKVFDLPITQEPFDKHKRKEAKAQDLWPNLRPELRELLISGTCPDCWREMFEYYEDNADSE